MMFTYIGVYLHAYGLVFIPYFLLRNFVKVVRQYNDLDIDAWFNIFKPIYDELFTLLELRRN